MNKNTNILRLTINTDVPKDLLYEVITKNLKEQVFEAEAVERLPEFSKGQSRSKDRAPFFLEDIDEETASKMLDMFSASKMGIQTLRADVMIKETSEKSADLIIDLAGPKGKSRSNDLNELNIMRSLVWRIYSRLIRGLN